MTNDIKCPRCGSDTVIRKAKKSPNAGQRFHVCIYYPDCKGRVQATDDQIRDKKATEETEAKGGWSKDDWLYDVDFHKSIANEQERAIKTVRERMDMPDIDDRNFMLLELDCLSLFNTFNTQQAKWDVALQEHAALMETEDLSEGPSEALQEWRIAFEKRKAQLREDIDNNIVKMREIVAQSQE